MSASKTHWAHKISRPVVAEFEAYSSRGAASDALHLDANESPWPPPPAGPQQALYARYPAQQPPALRTRLAALYGVEADRIMIGRGADEAIDILVRTFCEPNRDSVLICSPTFGYFSTAAILGGARIDDVSLTDGFAWDIKAIHKSVQANAPKIVFLCSPNNPTGNSLTRDQVSELCQSHTHTLIVVDEAYVEFSALGSLRPLQDEFENLVILRTLSKAYGLAGVRCGVCIAHPEIIKLIRKVLPPYPIPRPVEQAVLAALTPAAMAVQKDHVDIIQSERVRLLGALPNSEYIAKVYPSDANFILIKTDNADGLLAALAAYHIKIRDFRRKIADHFRISIGSPAENDLLLLALGIDDSATTQPPRIGERYRKTNETDIAVRVNLDEPGTVRIDTGIGFFDHMLEQIARHGGFGLTLECKGDLEIDSHHSVEDSALALGEAMRTALGDKRGIGRYGATIPMDESLAQIAIDLSGRPAFRFSGDFPTESVGEFAAEMCPHFFQSLSQSLGAAIHMDVSGDNTHHMIEACFKGAGRAVRPALARHGSDLPSTKGTL